MKTEIRDIAFTPKPPLNKYNLWLHFKNRKPIMELWSNGKWNVIGNELNSTDLPIINLDNPEINLETLSLLEDSTLTQVHLLGTIDDVKLNTCGYLVLDRTSNICMLTFIINCNAIRITLNPNTGEIIENTTYIYRFDQIEDYDIKDAIVSYMRNHEVIEDNINIFEYNNYDLRNLLSYYHGSISNSQVCQVINDCLNTYNGLIHNGQLVVRTFYSFIDSDQQYRIVLTEKRTLYSIAIKEPLDLSIIDYFQEYYEPLLTVYRRVLQ